MNNLHRTRRWLTALFAGQRMVTVANFGVAAALAAATAILGLVLEDLLPPPGGPPPGTTVGSTPHRWLTLGGCLLALGLAVLWRGSLHRSTGTLFYLRLLDDAMPDLHHKAVDGARRLRLSLCTVSRWVDYEAATSDGAIELSGPCAEISTAIEAVINADRDDTGYTVAPNFAWPVALAVGAELPHVDGLQLLELPDPKAPPASARDVTFTPGDNRVRPTPIVCTAYTLPGRTSGAGHLGLLLCITRGLTPTAAFAGFAVSDYLHLHWPAGSDGAIPYRSDLTGPELAAITAGLADTLTGIYRTQVTGKTGRRTVVIAAALPKTVAFALGQRLADAQGVRFFTGTHLLHYDGATNTFVPMRVHPAQPVNR